MSTRIQPADKVRAKYVELSTERTEQLLALTIRKADEKLTAYFEDRLAKGLDPYPAPDHKVTLTIVDANDFRSGNDPAAQSAWENISATTPDGLLVVKRVHEELKDAGFHATVKVDESRSIVVTVSDPLAAETLFAASFALTVNVYEVFGVNPVSVIVVAPGPEVEPTSEEPLYTSYPVTPTLSVEAVHARLMLVSVFAVFVKLAGAVGG